VGVWFTQFSQNQSTFKPWNAEPVKVLNIPNQSGFIYDAYTAELNFNIDIRFIRVN
jgi:hypothetical protein